MLGEGAMLPRTLGLRLSLARFFYLLFIFGCDMVTTVVLSDSWRKIRFPSLPRKPLIVPLRITLVMCSPFLLL
jgi:hypothetical protein